MSKILKCPPDGSKHHKLFFFISPRANDKTNNFFQQTTRVLPWNKFCRESYHKGIDKHRNFSQNFKNSKPDSNIFHFLGNGSSEIHGKVRGIGAKFEDVIYQSKQRSQWKRSNEHRYKTKLNH